MSSYICLQAVIVWKHLELKTMVCHRSFSDSLQHMTEQIQIGRTNLLYISNAEGSDRL